MCGTAVWRERIVDVKEEGGTEVVARRRSGESRMRRVLWVEAVETWVIAVRIVD